MCPQSVTKAKKPLKATKARPKKRLAKPPVPRRAPGKALKELRSSLGITRESMARLLGMSVRKVGTVESNAQVNDQTLRRMVEIRRMLNELKNIIPPDFIGQWIKEPNDGFDGLSPLEVIERGQGDRIWQMVIEISEGHPN